MKCVMEVRGVTKSYGTSPEAACIRNLDLVVDSREFLAIMGVSGQGKSTLLHMMAGIVTPDAGTILYKGSSLATMTAREVDGFRRQGIGMVFQEPFAFTALTVAENLEFSCRRLRRDKYTPERVRQSLAEFGLEEQAEQLPSSLSTGQRRRLAIVRCLLMEPALILADEPTNDLDAAWCEKIIEVLDGHARRPGCAVVMVTHDDRCAQAATRKLRLSERGVVE